MRTHPEQDHAATRLAARFADCTQAQISSYLNDQHTRARHETGDAHTLMLDHIARTVTALREQGLWPHRHDPRACQ